ncbi:guanylate kinase [Candidatus Gracilibacteria bacterium]|nr:guanylate kinase [Candidatus Gracilibacteria bacterium]
MTQQGKIFFISGPSGVGKGTLISELQKKYPEFVFPPSCTTRSPRPGEKEGETYFFISLEEFKQKIKEGAFLEYACVHSQNFYGTLKEALLRPLKEGKIVIREFDVQGFEQARKTLPKESFTSIFLKPAEKVESLIERIRARAPISDDEIKKRVLSMKKELKKAGIYDHIIISKFGEINRLVSETEAIIFGKD